MDKYDKHFGVNPQNLEWEFLGKDYTNPDYYEKSVKVSDETFKFCLIVTKDFLKSELLKEQANFKKLVKNKPPFDIQSGKMSANYGKYETKLDVCLKTMKKYEEMLKELKG